MFIQEFFMRKILQITAVALTIGAAGLGAITQADAGPWRGGWHGDWRHGYWRGGWRGWRGHYWGGLYWGHAPWYWGGWWGPAFAPPAAYWGYYPAPPPPPIPPPPPQPRAEAPPPPPPPAPAAKSFIVYFPFDRSILTPQAHAVVADAADYAKRGHATHITVVGYTDASGSLGYNEALSEQRARVMAQALTKLGVAPPIIDVTWKGKHDLAVPTADGVREPLNRRSTIAVDF